MMYHMESTHSLVHADVEKPKKALPTPDELRAMPVKSIKKLLKKLKVPKSVKKKLNRSRHTGIVYVYVCDMHMNITYFIPLDTSIALPIHPPLLDR